MAGVPMDRNVRQISQNSRGALAGHPSSSAAPMNAAMRGAERQKAVGNFRKCRKMFSPVIIRFGDYILLLARSE